MKTLSFSCVEKLDKLLAKECAQTIRPLFDTSKNKYEKTEFTERRRILQCNCGFKTTIDSLAINDKSILEMHDRVHYKPRLRVGDKVKLYWKMRSKAKQFCTVCGVGLIEEPNEIFGGRFACNCIHDVSKELWFGKLLGTGEITEVFPVEMGKNTIGYYANIMAGNAYPITRREETEKLARKDGFKSADEMFAWFGKRYDLSQPKRFAVYRWKWI